MMLTGLAAIARKTGYPVVEVAGWKTRTRPGGMAGVLTITCHHTANGGAKGNYPSLRVVRDGRSGLPGPLAHYGLGLDGTIYVIAAGKCNHAGVSRSTDYINSYAIGIEAEAVGVPGTKGDWPSAQMDSYVRLCRALVDEFGLRVINVRGHKETCSPAGRKSDPSFSMPAFRLRVEDMSLSTPKEGDDVALDKDDLDKIAKAVWGHIRELTDADARAFGGTTKAKQEVSINTLLRFPPATARLRREVDQGQGALKDQMDELAADVANLRDIADQQAKLLTDLLTLLQK